MLPRHRIGSVPLLLALGLSLGCGVRVEPPKPTSVRQHKNQTLAFFDEVEKTLRETGGITQVQHRRLGTHLVYLRGHLEAAGVGTDEQRRALDEALYELGKKSMGPPPDWRPGEETPPEERIIKSGPLKELIPQIRKLVESLPDSDLLPPQD